MPHTWDGRALGEARSRDNEETLRYAESISGQFYAAAAKLGLHSFIEHCGLMNEHLKVLRRAHDAGHDIHMFNVHGSASFPMKTYEAQYLAEKFSYIFAAYLDEPEALQTFLREVAREVGEHRTLTSNGHAPHCRILWTASGDECDCVT